MPLGVLEYRLPGLQVEPAAALWLDDTTHVRVPSLDAVRRFAEPPPPPPPPAPQPDPRLALDFATDFPVDSQNPTNTAKLDQQLQMLVDLAKARGREPYPRDVNGFRPTPLSRFLQLMPVPFGAVFDTVERAQPPITNILEQQKLILESKPTVNEGRELARMFENETPGLYHRHALNWILFNRADVSPPRHARVAMALDVTIYAALGAAWWYKWLRPDYSRLLRPKEYEVNVLKQDRLEVLFDRLVQFNGQDPDDPNLDRECPQPTPGTPRHPAWPSGHSTYSAAGSHVLEYFFSPDTLTTPDDILYADFPTDSDEVTEPGWIAAELRRLAANIGEARLWGGVHWLDDHIAGQKIGRSAAQALIAQLETDCVPKLPNPLPPCNSVDPPPDDATIAAQANRAGPCDAGQDFIPQRPNRGAAFRRRFGVS